MNRQVRQARQEERGRLNPCPEGHKEGQRNGDKGMGEPIAATPQPPPALRRGGKQEIVGRIIVGRIIRGWEELKPNPKTSGFQPEWHLLFSYDSADNDSACLFALLRRAAGILPKKDDTGHVWYREA